MSIENKTICHDCQKKIGTHFYGMGAVRCDYCAGRFDEKNYQERVKRHNEKHQCENCGGTYIGIYECPHCCEHEFDPGEGYTCLNCGKDGNEEVQSAAYDFMKNVIKYGS